MSKILYIKASPRTGRSHSIAVADAFVEEYRKTHSADEIETIDIFTTKLPVFDLEAVTAKYKIMHNQPHSEADKKVWRKIVEVIERFKSADKYVFAVPMWNFSIPYRLKQYLDLIIQPGLTFTAGSDGYKGLVTGKPVFVAYARGGEYPAGTAAEAFDFQKKYLELILGFIGFTDIKSVTVEPTLVSPETTGRRQDAAIDKARQIATKF